MSTLQPWMRVTVIQQTTALYPTRNKTFVLPYIHDTETYSSWKNLTDTAKVVLPYNLKVRDTNNNVIPFGGYIYNPPSGQVPLLLKGDKVTIDGGFFSKKKPGTGSDKYGLDTQQDFQGFITNISNKKPIEIECQDNMYLLKQVQCPNKVFLASQYSVQTMLQELLNSSPITSHLTAIDGVGSSAIATNIGNFRTLNVTIAQVIETLRKDFKLECYFRGDQLRCSGIVYYPADRTNHNFNFQFNIIKSELEYKRTDDIQLGIVAYSVNKVELQTTNSRGHNKTKNTRLETFVTMVNGKPTALDPHDAKRGQGEIRTLYFWNVPTIAQLNQMAIQRLLRFHYEGWRGKFTTFGQPAVKHGDGAQLTDTILPERSGLYLIKGVKKLNGMQGYRQEIEIDCRIDQFSAADLANGL